MTMLARTWYYKKLTSVINFVVFLMYGVTMKTVLKYQCEKRDLNNKSVNDTILLSLEH